MKFEICHVPSWDEMARTADTTIFQSSAWLNFVAEAQGATPVVLTVTDGGERMGWFCGLIKKRFGLRILGSPFPGWTTSYMGFNLTNKTSRKALLSPLFRFAWQRLKCVHVELMDRHLEETDVRDCGYPFRLLRGYEVDLRDGEDQLWSALAPSTRRNVRRASREGVVVSEVSGDSFATEYYDQLTEVFARQQLRPTYGLKRVQLLLKHLEPTGQLLCLKATGPDGRCIATGIFPADANRMYFWGGASRTDSRILRPNEAIHWYAMRYWQQRSVSFYDMGGGGEYKRKFGGQPIAIPWLRWSALPGLETMRTLAQRLVRVRQRL